MAVAVDLPVPDRPSGQDAFTLYSCVTESFASIDFNDGEIVRHDASGKTYTDREFDSILPLFYYRQLLSDGRQPDTLRGVALTPQTVSMQSFYFRNSPSDINKVKPELYPLLEAMSGRVELQMPPDVFRIHDRIEFIDMATNRVNDRKATFSPVRSRPKDSNFRPHACRVTRLRVKSMTRGICCWTGKAACITSSNCGDVRMCAGSICRTAFGSPIFSLPSFRTAGAMLFFRTRRITFMC